MGRFSVFLFLGVIAYIFYIFVYQQWYLVSSTFGFVTLILVFVVFSFMSSAIETAFSTAHTDRNIQEALERDAAALAQRYDQLNDFVRNGSGIENFDREQRKLLGKLDRTNYRFKLKRESLEEASRSVYVGTFASLSVFLNIALAAALPYALVVSPSLIKPIGFNFISSLSLMEDGVKYTWSHIDLSGQKILVFFASSFPILVFGKVLPKEIGSLFNYTFAYRLNFIAIITVKVFGVIPRTLSWPLARLRNYVARKSSSN